MGERRDVVVTEADAGTRVDVFVVRVLPGLGRAAAKALVDDGGVRVDGRRARKGDRLRAGALVSVTAPSLDASALPDPDVAVRVLREEADFVAVDKQAGIPTHPLRPGELGTLANGLLARYPELRGVGYGPREPGIVHRLDTGTSGVLLVARTAPAFEELVAAQRGQAVEKRYLALVAGRVDAPLVVDAAIAPSRRDERKVVVAGDPMEAAALGAKSARTEARPVERFGPSATLVEVRVGAARRHQIRAHLAFVGHPLFGDALYGGPEVPGLARHFLHAAAIRFPRPGSATPVIVEAPLPAELEQVLASLRTR